MRHLAGFFLVCAIALPALAEDVPAPTQPNEPEPPKCAACEACPACPTCPPPPAPVEKKAFPHPFYVTDWQRLAELTKEDHRVFQWADFYAQKLDNAYLIGGIGITLGAGVALLSTLSRLTNDQWTTNTQWGLACGLSAAAFSALIAWTIAPKRENLYTVINDWNKRHPTQLLAP